MSATPTPACFDFVRPFEGNSLESYPDINGVWTIGRGHTGHDVQPGLKWTQEHVDAVFVADVIEAQSELLTTLITMPPATILTALTDFVFNLGIGHYNSSTLKMYVNRQQWSNVKTEILKWCHNHNGEVIPDLLKRRQAEADLIGVTMADQKTNSAAPPAQTALAVPVGWMPTQSTLAGSSAGLAIAQVTMWVFWYFTKINPPPEIACAWGTICAALVGYIFKDGGRK